jgi:hypothetical protein
MGQRLQEKYLFVVPSGKGSAQVQVANVDIEKVNGLSPPKSSSSVGVG